METLDTERFIECVRAHPVLYSKESEDDTAETRRQAWLKIASEIYPLWYTIPKFETYEKVIQLQRKWKNLRDVFTRELRLRQRAKAGEERNRRPYMYYKQLKFLMNDPSNTEAMESSSEEDSTVTKLRKSRASWTKKKLAKRTLQKQAELDIKQKYGYVKDNQEDRIGDSEHTNGQKLVEPDIKQEYVSEYVSVYVDNNQENRTGNAQYTKDIPIAEEVTNTIGSDNLDGDKLFLLSLVPEMRQLPAHVRMWARAKISKVMEEAVAKCCIVAHGELTTCKAFSRSEPMNTSPTAEHARTRKRQRNSSVSDN